MLWIGKGRTSMGSDGSGLLMSLRYARSGGVLDGEWNANVVGRTYVLLRSSRSGVGGLDLARGGVRWWVVWWCGCVCGVCTV